jgi:hypothetical protein
MAAPGARSAWVAACRWLLALALGAQIAGGTLITVRGSLLRLLHGRERWGESWAEARRRSLGTAYVHGLEQVEAAIPPSASYVLVDRVHDGTFAVLQGDLAPRRAWVVEDEHRVRQRWRRRGAASGLPAQVVVFEGLRAAPRSMPTAELAAQPARSSRGKP